MPMRLSPMRVLPALALLALAACETGRPYGAGGGGRVDFTEGSMLGASLSGADLQALYPAFVTAVESGASGQAVAWRGPSASGAVTPGAYLVGNLKPDPKTLLPLAAAVSFAEPMETELGLHALTRNANVRAGPSTDARVLEQLPSGTGVEAVGKVSGKPWLLVAVDGAIRGYVHESLTIKAPGTELDLAGGPVRRAHPCRAFDQTMTVGGRADRWSGAACDRGQGWRVEPKDPNAPQRLF